MIEQDELAVPQVTYCSVGTQTSELKCKCCDPSDTNIPIQNAVVENEKSWNSDTEDDWQSSISNAGSNETDQSYKVSDSDLDFESTSESETEQEECDIDIHHFRMRRETTRYLHARDPKFYLRVCPDSFFIVNLLSERLNRSTGLKLNGEDAVICFKKNTKIRAFLCASERFRSIFILRPCNF
jgi:hypothetical protein